MRHSTSHSGRLGSAVTWYGMAVNGLLVAIKLAAGLLGRSHALLADAVHSLSDLLTDAIVLLGLRLGRKEADSGHHFGHERIETLASAFVGLALTASGLYIGIDAGLKIYRHAECHPTWPAVAGAAVSIALKEALYQYTVHVGRRIRSRLVVANAWHHRSDALSSVAVLFGVLGTWMDPDWHVLDAYAALLVSFFIVKVGLETAGSSLREFTDTAPPPRIQKQIEECILTVEGVLGTHELRVRTSGGLYQMETHITVEGSFTVAEGHRIAKDVERCLIRDIPDMNRVIVHVDPAEEGPDKGPVT